MSDHYATFSQRHGFVPMPQQLSPKELSPKLRALIWANLHSFMMEGRAPGGSIWVVGGAAEMLLKQWFVEGEHRPVDEFPSSFSKQEERVKAMVYDQPLHKLLDFLEFLLRSRFFPDERKTFFAENFEECLAAWRVVDNMFLPISTEEEASAIKQALREVEGSGPKGARTHLKASADFLAKGKWADSVRESIHAVEATGKSIESGNTLADVLKNLRKKGRPIHPALVDGFLSIYGYTSDEKGVRHSMVNEEVANVGEKEAVFMFGSCASFARYLLRLSSEG